MGLVMQFSEGDRAGNRKRAVVVVGNQLGTASDNRARETSGIKRGAGIGADASDYVNGNPPLGAGEDDIRREADAPPFENELAEIDKRGLGLDLVFDDHAQALAMFADARAVAFDY
jgi:hypothetical protein